MITVFLSKYCREFTRLRRFFEHYNIEFEVVPLQATDQCLTLSDYKTLVRGLAKSEGAEDFELIVSQKKRKQLAPKLRKMTPEERVAFFNENITALRGAITYDSKRDITLLGFNEDEVRTLLPREVKKQASAELLQYARQLEGWGGMYYMKKRISIEVELEGVVYASDVEQAKKSLSREIRSELVWAITHSTPIEVSPPALLNVLDVWCDDEEEMLDIDFYLSVEVKAHVSDESNLFLLETSLANVLQDTDLIDGEVESVTVSISNIL